MKALVVKTTGEKEVVEFSNENALSVLQAGVGGYIEMVSLSEELTLWVNEEGKLVDLPHNFFGQFLWDNFLPVHQEDYIVGDIVLTGGADEEGNTLGLSEQQLEIITGMIEREENLSVA